MANINKVIGDTNNYIFGKGTAYLRQSTHSNDLMINPNDNFWSNSSPFYTMTALKPRTPLPLSYVDNQYSSQELSNSCSPLISVKDRTSSAISDNSLCIYGAFKSCANINTNSTSVNLSITGSADSNLKKLSKVWANCAANQSVIKSTVNGLQRVDNYKQKNRLVYRHYRLLRR